MATYNDYPESASNNAKKVLKWKEKYGSEVKGMTSVGWTRARQLASKEKLSYKTIARMAAFKRHQKNATVDPKYKNEPWKDRGYVAWLGWGGTSGVNWAIKKAESLRKNNEKLSHTPTHKKKKRYYDEESNDQAMIDGIIDILIKVEDKENRAELAQEQIAILKREVKDFDERDFLERLGLTMNDLPLYNISLDDFVEGMYKISLVDKPAIEENFLYFSEQKAPVLEFANEEKKEVVGPIMIPNKPILRFSPEKGYYNVQFTEEVIQEIMYKYSKDGLFNSFGIDHAYDTHDVTMLEVWMKESDNDKSVDYGYELPNGTVFVKAKIESDELFNAIKGGEINGFSIEIEANIEQINVEESMNVLEFAKELAKQELAFEAKLTELVTRIEALEAQQEQFEATEEVVEETAVEESFELNTEEPIAEAAEEVAEEAPAEVVEEEMAAEEEVEATEETVNEEMSAEGETVAETVEEEFEAEEEVNVEKVEEEFAAAQQGEEAEEANTVLEFNGITAEKVDLVNNFFARFK